MNGEEKVTAINPKLRKGGRESAARDRDGEEGGQVMGTLWVKVKGVRLT